jgi:hypothetical protein
MEELKVVITPLYENPSITSPGCIGRVEIALTSPAPGINKGSQVACIGGRSSFIIEGCNVDASDEKGLLHLTSCNIDGGDNFWVFNRKTVGDVKLLYYIWPQSNFEFKYRGWIDRLHWVMKAG